MPPPVPLGAVLPLIVLPVTVAGPPRSTSPPPEPSPKVGAGFAVELPLIVEFVNVSVPLIRAPPVPLYDPALPPTNPGDVLPLIVLLVIVTSPERSAPPALLPRLPK